MRLVPLVVLSALFCVHTVMVNAADGSPITISYTFNDPTARLSPTITGDTIPADFFASDLVLGPGNSAFYGAFHDEAEAMYLLGTATPQFTFDLDLPAGWIFDIQSASFKGGLSSATGHVSWSLQLDDGTTLVSAVSTRNSVFDLFSATSLAVQAIGDDSDPPQFQLHRTAGTAPVYAFDNVTVTGVLTPEPGTALLMAGAGLLTLSRRPCRG